MFERNSQEAYCLDDCGHCWGVGPYSAIIVAAFRNHVSDLSCREERWRGRRGKCRVSSFGVSVGCEMGMVWCTEQVRNSPDSMVSRNYKTTVSLSDGAIPSTIEGSSNSCSSIVCEYLGPTTYLTPETHHRKNYKSSPPVKFSICCPAEVSAIDRDDR